MLKVTNLSFSYNATPLLNNISFKLEKGEVATLLGASGSGKTTLFKLLTGIIPLKSGQIEINGTLNSSSISYMMQEDLLLPWRNVLRNMTLSSELGINSHPTASLIEEAKKLLEEIGLLFCKEMYPDQLSGGMRQRISLARALLQKRPLLLLDEPFGGLDVCTREDMYALLREIKKKRGTTILLVTHDFRDAISLSDRIFLLSHGKLSHEWQVDDTLRTDPTYLGNLLEHLRTTMMSN